MRNCTALIIVVPVASFRALRIEVPFQRLLLSSSASRGTRLVSGCSRQGRRRHKLLWPPNGLWFDGEIIDDRVIGSRVINSKHPQRLIPAAFTPLWGPLPGHRKHEPLLHVALFDSKVCISQPLAGVTASNRMTRNRTRLSNFLSDNPRFSRIIIPSC